MPQLAYPLRGQRDDDAPFRRELPLPSGNIFRRWLAARAIAALRNISAAAVAERHWPNDRILQHLTRAASLPAFGGTVGWAAELMRLVVMDALAAMGPAAAGPKLLAESTVLSFDGAGVISAPGFVASGANAGFVAEGAPIPVKQLAASAVQLQPHKLAAIAVLTEEMVMSSNAEELIGDTLVRSAGAALDVALFDSNAGTTARPPGLRYGITATPPSSLASNWDAFFQDASNLINTIAAVGGAGPYYEITGPGRAVQMRLRALGEPGDPFYILGSTAVGNDVIAVAPAALVCAIDPEPDIEVANVTALHMADPASPIVNGGAPASPERSVFQTDGVALKMRWRVSWGLRDPRGVAWLTPTQW